MSRLNFCSVAPSSNVRLQHHRVVGDQQRIENFVNRDRLVLLQARTEIFVLEHSREAVFCGELDHLLAGEFVEPFGVVADFGFFRIEDFEHLREIRFRVRLHLIAREGRARRGLAGRIAD